MIETDTQATLAGRFRGIEPENCPGSNEVPMPSSSCSTTWTSTCTAARPSCFFFFASQSASCAASLLCGRGSLLKISGPTRAGLVRCLFGVGVLFEARRQQMGKSFFPKNH